MKKTLLIHIGPIKTGTTAIQKFLAINRGELKKQGVLYPGKYDNHYLVANELGCIDNPYLDEKSQTYEVFSEIVSNYNNYQKFILSSEGFCEHDSKVIPALIKTIEYFNLVFSVQIVIFIRPQPQWVESAYQQSVKETTMRTTDSFQEFVDKKKLFIQANYSLLLDKWSYYFGKENIIINHYNSNQHQKKIYTDFIDILVLSLNLHFKEPEKKASNIGLKPDSIEFLRWLNILEITTEMFEQIIGIITSETKSRIHGNKFLTPELTEKIENYFESANTKVAKEFFKRYNDVLFEKHNSKLAQTNETSSALQQVFNPAIFNLYFAMISDADQNILIKLYQHLFHFTSPSLKYVQTKKSVNELLEIFIPSRELDVLRQDIRINKSDDINLLHLFETSSVVLTVTANNFACKTFGVSDQITSNIDYNSRKIRFTSSSNDPYFSIEKGLGNYDSVTLIRIKMDVPKDTLVKIYYQTRSNTEYCESQSIVQSIKKGLYYVFFEIIEPNFNGQIRVDPGSIHGVYEIHEILVKSNAKSYDELFFENKMLKSDLINNG